MALADLLTARIRPDRGRKPRDDGQLDLLGLTRPGNGRCENQDTFFVGTIHKQVGRPRRGPGA
jgi:hypothetical protein